MAVMDACFSYAAHPKVPAHISFGWAEIENAHLNRALMQAYAHDLSTSMCTPDIFIVTSSAPGAIMT